MIIKGFVFLLLLSGHIALASADYAGAMRNYERQQYREALQEFRELARGEDADAQYMLGRMHEAGNGTLRISSKRTSGTTWRLREAIATRLTPAMRSPNG